MTVQDTAVPAGGGLADTDRTTRGSERGAPERHGPQGEHCRPDLVRVLIYGSCVSRDAVEADDDLVVASYIARQSIISATTPPVAVRTDETSLSSAFQRRMLLGDVGSDALKRIGDAEPGADVVLLDLIDERLGVLQVDSRSYVTSSAEFRHSTLPETMPGARRIPFGTAEHFRLWRAGADRMIRELRRLGVAARTGFIWAAFAEHDENGDPVAQYQNKSAATWNALFNRYYRYLADVGLRYVRLDPDVRTSLQHKWGPQPYHYAPDVYTTIGDFVRSIGADRRREVSRAAAGDPSIEPASTDADRVGCRKDVDVALLDAVREIYDLKDRLGCVTRERDAAAVERDAARRDAARLSKALQDLRSSATVRAGAALRAAAAGRPGLVRLPMVLWQIGRDRKKAVRETGQAADGGGPA